MAENSLEKSVLQQMGEPGDVARDLARYRKEAKALSSKHPRYIEAYPRQWVLIYDGEVKARGQTMQSVLVQAKRQNIPTEHAIVRFIDRTDRTFIL